MENGGICLTFDSCTNLTAPDQTKFVSSQIECPTSKSSDLIIIVSGVNQLIKDLQPELLDFRNESCDPTFELFAPAGIQFGTGGYFKSGELVICGGQIVDSDPYSSIEFNEKCYKADEGQMSFYTKMTSVRAFASGTVVQNGKKLWILGGYDGYNILNTTEYIENGVSYSGPELPLPLTDFDIVNLNESTYFILGGASSDQEFSEKTFFYSEDGKEWINGPDLMHGRYGHKAGLITDSVTQEQYIAVVGGYGYDGLTDSVEILINASQFSKGN